MDRSGIYFVLTVGMFNVVKLYVSDGIILEVRIEDAGVVPIHQMKWSIDECGLHISQDINTGRTCCIYTALNIDHDVPEDAYIDRDSNAAIILRAFQKELYVSFDEQAGCASVVVLKENGNYYVEKRTPLSHVIYVV